MRTIPKIARTDLPVNLSTILVGLEPIDAATEKAGGELTIASFKWLVADGMVLDPVRQRLILEYLHFGYAPFRYRDPERLALFQNRVAGEVRQGPQGRLPRCRAVDAVRSGSCSSMPSMSRQRACGCRPG